jgi:hypothetical protein
MRHISVTALAAAGLLGLSAAASAAGLFAEPSLKQTMGSGGYEATSASVDIGTDAFHARPQFDAYHSNTSSGTFKTWSLRLAYDTDGEYSFTGTIGGSPENDGYSRRYFGVTVDRSIDFVAAASTAAGSGVDGLDLSAGFTHTAHTDQYQLATVKGRRVVVRRVNELDVEESDLTGSATVRAGDDRVSLDVLKAVYNKDLGSLSARAAPVAQLSGLLSTVSGFPNLNAALRVQTDRWDGVSPYLSYTYTSYAVAQPVSQAFAVGTVVHLGVELDAAYQRFSQRTAADINYYSLQGSYRFR